jgi:hypothetical protein
MKIERRWKLMTQILGAAGCGGSTQSASSTNDASSDVAVTPPASTGTGPITGTGSTPVATTPVA